MCSCFLFQKMKMGVILHLYPSWVIAALVFHLLPRRLFWCSSVRFLTESLHPSSRLGVGGIFLHLGDMNSTADNIPHMGSAGWVAAVYPDKTEWDTHCTASHHHFDFNTFPTATSFGLFSRKKQPLYFYLFLVETMFQENALHTFNTCIIKYKHYLFNLIVF